MKSIAFAALLFLISSNSYAGRFSAAFGWNELIKLRDQATSIKSDCERFATSETWYVKRLNTAKNVQCKSLRLANVLDQIVALRAKDLKNLESRGFNSRNTLAVAVRESVLFETDMKAKSFRRIAQQMRSGELSGCEGAAAFEKQLGDYEIRALVADLGSML